MHSRSLTVRLWVLCVVWCGFLSAYPLIPLRYFIYIPYRFLTQNCSGAQPLFCIVLWCIHRRLWHKHAPRSVPCLYLTGSYFLPDVFLAEPSHCLLLSDPLRKDHGRCPYLFGSLLLCGQARSFSTDKYLDRSAHAFARTWALEGLWRPGSPRPSYSIYLGTASACRPVAHSSLSGLDDSSCQEDSDNLILMALCPRYPATHRRDAPCP